jgi:hypothetical protein
MASKHNEISDLIEIMRRIEAKLSKVETESAETYQIVSSIPIKLETIEQIFGQHPESRVVKKPAKRTVKKEVVVDPEEESEDMPKKPVDDFEVKEVSKKPKMNKINFFKKMFISDPGYFDAYLTDTIKQKIDSTLDLNQLDDVKKIKAQCDAYYKYMNTNHLAELNTMRDEYNDA